MLQQQNCTEKTTPISSTTNEWSQNQIITIDDQNKSFNMASSSSSAAAANNNNKASTMDKTNAAAPDPHQQPLKCPRCDSSNTKFCYYNNYSLSQPRHFCKACKRYWTRGGTLRNVPVGGGCRKNKRVKRSSQPSTINGDIGVSSSAVGSVATANPSSHIVQPPMNNPLFYSLPSNPMEMNYPFSRFGSTRVSSELSDGFDLQPHMNGVGLGFEAVRSNEYNNGFRQIHDHGISTSRFMSSVGNNSINPTFFGSSSSTMASLLASSLQSQKFGSGGVKEVQENQHNFPGLMPYDQDIGMGKEVKNEGENRFEWNHNNNNNNNNNNNQNILGQHINSSDSSSLLWNTTNGGAGGVWFDPSNIGSSVPSLI